MGMGAIRVCSGMVDWVSADTPIKTTTHQQEKMRGTTWLSVLLPLFQSKKEKTTSSKGLYGACGAGPSERTGRKFYALNRSKSDPQVYKVLESYEDHGFGSPRANRLFQGSERQIGRSGRRTSGY